MLSFSLSRSAVVRSVFCALFLTLQAGCFDKVYEQRMQTTIEVYEHLETLDNNLSGEWRASGISFRAPQQFILQPPPEIPLDSEGNPVSDQVLDERQPDFLSKELPGLVGAWEANLQVEVGEEVVEQPGFLYVLSNHSRFITPDDAPNRPKPETFHADLVQLLGSEFQIQVQDSDWVKETFPQKFPYAAKVAYDATSKQSERSLRGMRRKFSLWLYTDSTVQVAILLIVPEGVSSSEALTERMSLALETLRVTGGPKAGAPGGGATTNPGATF